MPGSLLNLKATGSRKLPVASFDSIRCSGEDIVPGCLCSQSSSFASRKKRCTAVAAAPIAPLCE